jgi:hypothetical protein
MARVFAVLMVGCLVAGLAVVGVADDASAGGDNNQHTQGEDGGNYFENNNNPYDDDYFPGQSSQNRSGIVW